MIGGDGSARAKSGDLWSVSIAGMDRCVKAELRNEPGAASSPRKDLLKDVEGDNATIRGSFANAFAEPRTGGPPGSKKCRVMDAGVPAECSDFDTVEWNLPTIS